MNLSICSSVSCSHTLLGFKWKTTFSFSGLSWKSFIFCSSFFTRTFSWSLKKSCLWSPPLFMSPLPMQSRKCSVIKTEEFCARTAFFMRTVSSWLWKDLNSPLIDRTLCSHSISMGMQHPFRPVELLVTNKLILSLSLEEAAS